MLPFFDHLFASEQIGFEKPSENFFDACFAALSDISPEESMIIGDSITADMMGGLRYGIQTCWFNPKYKPRRPDIHVDYEIDALMELPQLLKTL